MAHRPPNFADMRRLLGIAAAMQEEHRGFTAKLEKLLSGVSEVIEATVAQAHRVTYLSRSRHQSQPLTEVAAVGTGGQMQRSRLAGVEAPDLMLGVLDRPDRVITSFGSPVWMEDAHPWPATRHVLCSTQFIGSSMTAIAIIFVRPAGARRFLIRELQIVDMVWRSYRVASRPALNASSVKPVATGR